MTAETFSQAAGSAHLTESLRRCGALGAGRVDTVEVVSSRTTVLSRVIRLRLTYDGAVDNAPTSLIPKTEHPERAGRRWYAGRQEVAFYSKVAAAMPAPLVPHCFEASWDDAGKAWHLLLTDTHMIATAWPLPPTMPHCESILDA